MRQTAGAKMLIEIYSDTICPWCWVGKRNLEKALDTYKTPMDAEVIWRPYMLRPGTPLEGVPKAPDTPNNRRVGPHLKAAGARAGIDFTGLTDRTPNTLLPHALLEHALEDYGSEKQNEVQEQIFQAYFTDGIFPNFENLVKIGVKCGLDKSKVEEVLTDRDSLEHLKWTIQQNSKAIKGGVPFFVFNGEPGFSGARDPFMFHEVFDIVIGE